jgi:hypothetical protein
MYLEAGAGLSPSAAQMPGSQGCTATVIFRQGLDGNVSTRLAGAPPAIGEGRPYSSCSRLAGRLATRISINATQSSERLWRLLSSTEFRHDRWSLAKIRYSERRTCGGRRAPDLGDP